MFKLVFDNPRAWKSYINAISEVVTQGNLEVTQEGISLAALHPSSVMLLSFFLPKSAFVEYELESDKKIGLDFEKLRKIFSRVKNDDKIHIIDEGKGDLNIILEGKSTRNFSVPLLDINKDSKKDLDIQYDSYVKVVASDFLDALKDVELTATRIELVADPASFIVRGEGDLGNVNVEMKTDSGALIELKTLNRISAGFNIAYLMTLAKNADANSIITIHMKEEVPVKFEYKMDEAHFKYYVAQWME